MTYVGNELSENEQARIEANYNEKPEKVQINLSRNCYFCGEPVSYFHVKVWLLIGEQKEVLCARCWDIMSMLRKKPEATGRSETITQTQ